jgi:tetratricopeptide (TPR) repeat protein
VNFSSSSKTKLSDSAIVVNIVSDFDDLFVIVVGGGGSGGGVRSVTVKELPQQTQEPSPQTNNNFQQKVLRRKNEDFVEEEKSSKLQEEQTQTGAKHHKFDPIQDLSPQQKETLAEELKNEGNQYMQKKMYVDAVTKYTDAISLNPINPVYYANRAQAYLYLKKYNGKYSSSQSTK